MTYNAIETSVESGSPVEVYEFDIGGDPYRYASGEEEVTVNGLDYQPLEISRTTIVVSNERGGDVLSITMPATTPLVRRFINIVPGSLSILTIRRRHRTDVDNEYITMFKGVVRSVGFTLDGLQARIAVQPITGALSRTIPRDLYAGLCNKVLYDDRCTVNSSSFRYEGLISSISGAAYTISGLSSGSRPDGWADAGFMVSPNGTDYRLILDHTGDVATLLLPFTEDVVAGQTVEVFAGCKHDIDTCSSKFNNVLNFGGFHWVPLKNVFTKGIF